MPVTYSIYSCNFSYHLSGTGCNDPRKCWAKDRKQPIEHGDILYTACQTELNQLSPLAGAVSTAGSRRLDRQTIPDQQPLSLVVAKQTSAKVRPIFNACLINKFGGMGGGGESSRLYAPKASLLKYGIPCQPIDLPSERDPDLRRRVIYAHLRPSAKHKSISRPCYAPTAPLLKSPLISMTHYPSRRISIGCSDLCFITLTFRSWK